MAVLITGGAGYIGCHTAKRLSELGRDIVVIDNLSTGDRRNVRWGKLVEGDIGDASLVRKVLREHDVSAVIHLAASTHIGESMARPDLYFENNTVGTKTVLDAMHREGVKRIVFASSCSVYGSGASETMTEAETACPASPYGESKLAAERILRWYGRCLSIDWITLRYFNVAGAEDDLGEDPAVSQRIVPRAFQAAFAAGRHLQVNGTSFATRDGSAVRDFVHVSDVAAANVLALDWIERNQTGETMNIGSGTGTTVFEVIEAVEEVTGKKVPRDLCNALEGDPAHAVADLSHAHNVLGWMPQSSRLSEIVGSMLRSCESRRSCQREVSST